MCIIEMMTEKESSKINSIARLHHTHFQVEFIVELPRGIF
jgi:hypothetical protein